MARDEALALAALVVVALVAIRARGPIVETIPQNEPLRGRVLRLDDGWRLDQ
jgi:hypothetical protein